jgi:hypothetical protein
VQLKRVPVERLSQEARLVFDLIAQENDIGAVSIAAGFLDEVVGALLAAFLVESPTSQRLIDHDGAVGGYAQRCDLALSLALIDDAAHHDLRAIGELRNRFAHGRMKLTFANVDICEICESLQTVTEWLESEYAPIPATLAERARQARGQFTLAVGILAEGLITQAAAAAKRRAEWTPMPSIASAFQQSLLAKIEAADDTSS